MRLGISEFFSFFFLGELALGLRWVCTDYSAFIPLLKYLRDLLRVSSVLIACVSWPNGACHEPGRRVSTLSTLCYFFARC